MIPVVLTLLRGNENTGIVGLYNQSIDIARTGFNPNVGAAVFPSSTTPIPAGFVPLGGIDPATGFPLNGEFPISEETTQFSVRVDHQINTRNNATLRYLFVPSEASGLTSNAPNRSRAITHFRARREDSDRPLDRPLEHDGLRRRYVNEARFQYAYRSVDFLPQSTRSP